MQFKQTLTSNAVYLFDIDGKKHRFPKTWRALLDMLIVEKMKLYFETYIRNEKMLGKDTISKFIHLKLIQANDNNPPYIEIPVEVQEKTFAILRVSMLTMNITLHIK